LRYDMEISLEEAFHGKDRPRSIDVSQRCANPVADRARARLQRAALHLCGGHGKVRSAAGLLHGRAHLPHLPRRGEGD
jgi:molecular chaperone DnaJ